MPVLFYTCVYVLYIWQPFGFYAFNANGVGGGGRKRYAERGYKAFERKFRKLVRKNIDFLSMPNELCLPIKTDFF